MSEITMYTTGAHLQPMKVVNNYGESRYVWAVTSFEDLGFLDGKDYDPVESAEDLETLIIDRNGGETKWVMLREFIYGQDVTEFDENEVVVLYDTEGEADQSLKEYINDVNVAYQKGYMDEPYQNDVQIRKVTVYDDEGYMEDVETKQRFNLIQE